MCCVSLRFLYFYYKAIRAMLFLGFVALLCSQKDLSAIMFTSDLYCNPLRFCSKANFYFRSPWYPDWDNIEEIEEKQKKDQYFGIITLAYLYSLKLFLTLFSQKLLIYQFPPWITALSETTVSGTVTGVVLFCSCTVYLLSKKVHAVKL